MKPRPAPPKPYKETAPTSNNLVDLMSSLDSSKTGTISGARQFKKDTSQILTPSKPMGGGGAKQESPPIKPTQGRVNREATPPTHVIVSPTSDGGVQVTPYTDAHALSDDSAIYAVPRSLLSESETTCDKSQSSVTNAQEVRYRAAFDYETSDPSEVNLSVGDIVIFDPFVTAPPGWLMVTMETSGESGWAPESYLQSLTEAGKEESEVSSQEYLTCKCNILRAYKEKRACNYVARKIQTDINITAHFNSRRKSTTSYCGLEF